MRNSLSGEPAGPSHLRRRRRPDDLPRARPAPRGEPIAQHLGPESVFFKPIDGDALIRAIADARPIAPRPR